MERDYLFAGHAKPNTARSWRGFVAHAYCGGGRHSATNMKQCLDICFDIVAHKQNTITCALLNEPFHKYREYLPRDPDGAGNECLLPHRMVFTVGLLGFEAKAEGIWHQCFVGKEEEMENPRGSLPTYVGSDF